MIVFVKDYTTVSMLPDPLNRFSIVFPLVAGLVVDVEDLSKRKVRIYGTKSL